MERRKGRAGLILGSYAAFPPLGSASATQFGGPENESGARVDPRGDLSVDLPVDVRDGGQADFQRQVRDLPFVSGLELPYSRMGLLKNSSGLDAHEQLGFGWKLVVTFLPAQMEHMELDPSFGLASSNENSRRAAVLEVQRLMSELKVLLTQRPDVELLGISLPTGPRVLYATKGAVVENEPVDSSARALRESLVELRALELFKKINLEHCDAKTGVGPIAKGFLSIEDEIAAARDFGLGLVINWGRSAIEGHSAKTPEEHLQKIASEAKIQSQPSLVRGLILSGAAIQHPLYGEWLDTHAPIREAFGLPGFEIQDEDLGGDPRLLLSLSEARACWDLVTQSAGQTRAFVGVKVQPLPRSLSVEERLKFLKRHLEKLHAVLGLK